MKKLLYIVMAITCLQLVWSNFTLQEPLYENRTVIVRAHDSLWSIAGAHAHQKEDVRDLVKRIYTANGLKSSFIYPGQVLKVPVLVEGKSFMLANK